MKVNCTNL